jgi:energy-coupling factor transporter ATP-binding protein EcfA2
MTMYTSVLELRIDLLTRLADGDHIVLYGPRGSGKSTLTQQLYAGFNRDRVPCALCKSTASLDDITRTMEAAYPQVDTHSVSRKTARARLRDAADHRACVLLLDHVTDVGTAMVGFGRRLRGGLAGVLFVFDVDVEREKQRMRHKRLALSVRMPPAPLRQLRVLLRACCAERGLDVDAETELQILKAAQGRPGWIVQAMRLIRQSRYWHEGHLYPTLLCTDTEITVRQGDLSLLVPNDWSAQSGRAWPNPILKEVELWKR